MKAADTTIEMHWLEYPEGIPVEAWGRDHNSTLLYAETRAVDYDGKLPEGDPHMRVSREYPTRLHNSVQVHGHTDYDCLKDAEAAGFLTYEYGVVRFTDEGWTYVAGLRRQRAEAALKSGAAPLRLPARHLRAHPQGPEVHRGGGEGASLPRPLARPVEAAPPGGGDLRRVHLEAGRGRVRLRRVRGREGGHGVGAGAPLRAQQPSSRALR